MITDPIADGLTKLRNASRARHATVEVRASKFLAQVLEVIKREGYIRMVKPIGTEPSQRALKVYLKPVNSKRIPAITQVVRVSRPGMRVYRKSRQLPRILRGLGTAVVSTSRGLMTERDAYQQKLGGEIICYIW